MLNAMPGSSLTLFCCSRIFGIISKALRTKACFIKSALCCALFYAKYFLSFKPQEEVKLVSFVSKMLTQPDDGTLGIFLTRFPIVGIKH